MYVHDHLAGKDIPATVRATAPLTGGATLYRVDLTDESGIEGLPLIVHSDGATFAPDDWQQYWGDELDIEAISWVCADGLPAVMLDGLPRRFGS